MGVIAYLYQKKTFIIKYLEETIKNYIFIRASNIIFSDDLVSRKSLED